MKPICFALILIILTFSCNEVVDDPCCLPPNGSGDLMGSWQLYETGLSPGSGYIVNKVPVDPAQTITFLPNRAMVSNIQGLEQYKFYLTRYDTAHSMVVLSLFKNDPYTAPDPSPPSYSIVFEDNTLKLSYRWCIEGCHLGFRRINED
jgi:hypothetical protein